MSYAWGIGLQVWGGVGVVATVFKSTPQWCHSSCLSPCSFLTSRLRFACPRWCFGYDFSSHLVIFSCCGCSLWPPSFLLISPVCLLLFLVFGRCPCQFSSEVVFSKVIAHFPLNRLWFHSVVVHSIQLRRLFWQCYCLFIISTSVVIVVQRLFLFLLVFLLSMQFLLSMWGLVGAEIMDGLQTPIASHSGVGRVALESKFLFLLSLLPFVLLLFLSRQLKLGSLGTLGWYGQSSGRRWCWS